MLLNGGGASGGNGGRRVGGSKTLGAIQAYVGHDVFLASLSFCLLFMTVLDNGTLITSYFTWRDIHASVLGLQRGVGAACGLAGTFFRGYFSQLVDFSIKTDCLNVSQAQFVPNWNQFVELPRKFPNSLIDRIANNPHKSSIDNPLSFKSRESRFSG